MSPWPHLPSTFCPVCLQVGDGGVEHLQPELWEAGGADSSSAVPAAPLQRYPQGHARQSLPWGPAGGPAALPPSALPSPVADGCLVPGELSSEGGGAGPMGHLLWGVREEAGLDAELLKDLVLPEGQSFWMTFPPLHDLVFLKTEWNSSHVP